MKKFERVKAVVSLDAIAHNFEEMKKNIADGTRIVAVIKADGYGHGAEAISRLIEDYEYIWGFATATAEEAIQLKDAGIEKPVLILGLVFDLLNAFRLICKSNTAHSGIQCNVDMHLSALADCLI